MNRFFRAAIALSLVTTPAFLSVPTFAQSGEGQADSALNIDVDPPKALQPESETPWLYRGSDVPVDREWLFGEMKNGLRYAVRNNGVPPDQISIRVRVDVGALHERDAEQGYAHLLEHLLFRESKYLGKAEAIAAWQRLGATFGADANAFTSPTQTAYQIDLPDITGEKLVTAMKYISGMVREPVLSDENVAAELPIVLAEKRERGGAGERVQTISRETLFAGQRLSKRSPIGILETLNAANGAKLSEFHRLWYRPENTVVVIVGDADPKMLAGLVEQWFGDWQGQGEAGVAPDFGDPVAPEGSVVAAGTGWPIGEMSVAVEPDLPRNFTYTIMRPWRLKNDTIVYNEGKTLDQLALEIINRRLETRARSGGSFLFARTEKDDISRSTNATVVRFAPLTSDWQTALSEVRGVIADALAKPPTQEEIDREAAEFEIGYVNFVEQSSVQAGSQLADSIVGAVDIRETVASPEIFLSVWNGLKDRLTPDEIFARTKALFKGDVVRSVYVAKTEGEADGEALKQALTKPVESDSNARLAAETIKFEDLPAVGKPGAIASQKLVGLAEIEQVNFANGVRALLWSNDAEPGRVTVKVRFGAGYRAFDADSAVYASIAETALVGSGLGELGQNEIDRLATGRKLGFDFGISEAVFTFTAQTRSDDVEDQLYLFAAKLGMPRWDEAPVLRAKAAAELAYDTYATGPGNVINRDLKYLVTDRDARYQTPTPQALQKVTPEGFRSVWEPLLQQGPVEVLIFGEFDKPAIVKKLTETFGALPDRKPIPADVSARVPSFPGAQAMPTVLEHRGDANQAAAVIAWKSGGGIKGLRESRQLEILTQLLGNRLLDEIREKAGAAYAPQAFSQWPVDISAGGTITALAQIEPELIPLFFSEADRIARDLANNPPSKDEIDRVTGPLGQLIQRASTGNQFWLRNLEGATFDPQRVQLVRSMLADYSNTSPQIMQFLADRYFVQGSPLRLAVIPEGQELAETKPLAPAKPRTASGPIGPVQGPGIESR